MGPRQNPTMCSFKVWVACTLPKPCILADRQAGPFSDDLDDGNDDLALGGGGGKRRRQQQQGGAGGAAVDDEVYTAAREAAAAKKQKRKEAYKYPETLPPVADPTTTDARKITRGVREGWLPHADWL